MSNKTGSEQLYINFLALAEGIVGERHKNYFFNKGEKMTVTLDGLYTAEEISNLHWRLMNDNYISVVVGGKLEVEMKHVIVTAEPKSGTVSGLQYDSDKDQYYVEKMEDRGNGDRPVRHYMPHYK